MIYKIIRKHEETYAVDVEASSETEAIDKAKALEDGDYEHVGSGEYNYSVE